MKQGIIISKIVVSLLFAAVLLYLGVYLWRAFQDPLTTTMAYTFTVDNGVEATGVLVREEMVLPGQSRIADILPAEGEKVAKGETVAVLYRDAAALERKQQLRTLDLELEQLQYSLRRQDAGSDSARLSHEILDAMVSLRSSVSRRELTDVEDQAMNLKSLIYKRGYTYGSTASPMSTAQRITALDAQASQLRAEAAQDTTTITVERSGVFSGMADGYEGILTPTALETLTPSALKALGDNPPQVDEGAIGKLITSSRWYFTCLLSEADAQRLVEGRQIKVRFSRDWSGEVSMRVERISAPENGQVAVSFSSTHYLSETTLLRRQTVDLVFDTVTGLRVPHQALRQNEEGLWGVYALVGSQAEFKQVNVLADQEDFFLVAPVKPEKERETRKMLRSGDVIIVSGQALFDGKVVVK